MSVSHPFVVEEGLGDNGALAHVLDIGRQILSSLHIGCSLCLCLFVCAQGGAAAMNQLRVSLEGGTEGRQRPDR